MPKKSKHPFEELEVDEAFDMPPDTPLANARSLAHHFSRKLGRTFVATYIESEDVIEVARLPYVVPVKRISAARAAALVRHEEALEKLSVKVDAHKAATDALIASFNRGEMSLKECEVAIKALPSPFDEKSPA